MLGCDQVIITLVHSMKTPRRTFLHLAAGAAALPAVARIAKAHPARPLRMIIGYPPGGSADITARLTGQWLSERLGQPVLIESRPGAATNLATETVVRAAPDGYTLLLVAPANCINATLYDKLNFNFLRDLAPVAGIIRVPTLWWLIHCFRSRRSQNWSPMPRPIPASSTWHRPATDRRSTCRASCSR